MSFSKFATFSTIAILGTARIFRFTASRRITCCVMNSSVCSHCLRFQSKGSGGREVRILLCSKVWWGRKSTKFWKWHCLTNKNSARIRTPYPKLMIMVSFCWKMNFPHNKTKINSVLLMMSLKLTIKVVAFFLGHPVYVHLNLYQLEMQK